MNSYTALFLEEINGKVSSFCHWAVSNHSTMTRSWHRRETEEDLHDVLICGRLFLLIGGATVPTQASNPFRTLSVPALWTVLRPYSTSLFSTQPRKVPLRPTSQPNVKKELDHIIDLQVHILKCDNLLLIISITLPHLRSADSRIVDTPSPTDHSTLADLNAFICSHFEISTAV